MSLRETQPSHLGKGSQRGRRPTTTTQTLDQSRVDRIYRKVIMTNSSGIKRDFDTSAGSSNGRGRVAHRIAEVFVVRTAPLIALLSTYGESNPQQKQSSQIAKHERLLHLLEQCDECSSPLINL